MTDRERLIELIVQSTQKCDSTDCNRCKYWNTNDCGAARMADHILSDGWIRPPCKVGDTVYVIMETSCEDIDLVHTVCEFYNEKHEDLCTLTRGKCPYKYIIINCEADESNILSFSERFGKTVFLTREEAEQALAERQGKNEKP